MISSSSYCIPCCWAGQVKKSKKRKNIKITTISTQLPCHPTPLVTAIIYRPPKPTPTILSDFHHFLTQLSAISPLSSSLEISISTLTTPTANLPLTFLKTVPLLQFHTRLPDPLPWSHPWSGLLHWCHIKSSFQHQPLISPILQSSWTSTSPWPTQKSSAKSHSETSSSSIPQLSQPHCLMIPLSLWTITTTLSPLLSRPASTHNNKKPSPLRTQLPGTLCVNLQLSPGFHRL